MKNFKPLITIILLLSSIIISFTLPKPKYVSTNFFSELKMPTQMPGWEGEDIPKEILENVRYSFPLGIFARRYINMNGGNLLLLIYEGGLHYPKMCFTGSGFTVKELNNIEFNIPGRTFKALAFYSEKPEEQILTIYWMTLDKKVISTWAGHRVKQLYLSLLRKKRIGLMIRLDIPVKKDNIKDGFTLAKKFINGLSQSLHSKQADYLFGRVN